MSAVIEMNNYPGRAELIGSMGPLLKAARGPWTAESERPGPDDNGRHQLDVLAHRLARNVHFEHLDHSTIRDNLHAAMMTYHAMAPSARPAAREFAAETLDTMAQEPVHGTLYLGIENLLLPHGTVVGDVRFVDPQTHPEILESLTRLRDAAPSLLCEVAVTAGTAAILRDRARDIADTSIGLLRQQNLFGFNAKIYLDQVLYRLDGTWAWQDGSGVTLTGWWRERPHPIPMDLAHPNLEHWRARLAELSDLYLAVPAGVRSRVDTCIDWLNVAALSDRWRVIIPAIFSGMEALLVPESVGFKAEIVTVRSVAVHVARGHGFFDPGEIMTAYHLRSDLIHGTPTSQILETDATGFAEFRRLWAFRVLCDYLELAVAIGATDVRDLVSYLDGGKCHDVCTWLEHHDGSPVVREYRNIFRDRPGSPDAANSAE